MIIPSLIPSPTSPQLSETHYDSVKTDVSFLRRRFATLDRKAQTKNCDFRRISLKIHTANAVIIYPENYLRNYTLLLTNTNRSFLESMHVFNQIAHQFGFKVAYLRRRNHVYHKIYFTGKLHDSECVLKFKRRVKAMHYEEPGLSMPEMSSMFVLWLSGLLCAWLLFLAEVLGVGKKSVRRVKLRRRKFNDVGVQCCMKALDG